MIGINFNKWSGSSGRFLKCKRIYFKGYIWTPFIRMRKRYKSWFNIILERGDNYE